MFCRSTIGREFLVVAIMVANFCRSASIVVIVLSKNVCDCERLEMVEVWDSGKMMVAFGLLVDWCLKWFVVGFKQVVYGGVVIVVVYDVKGNAESFVVDKGV